MLADAEPGSTLFAFYEAWNDRDLERCQALLHPRCTIDDRLQGELIAGQADALAWLARRAAARPDTVTEVIRLLTEGDTVVAETASRAPGMSGEERRCEVDEIRRGRICNVRIYEGGAM